MATFDGFEFVDISEMLEEVSPDEVPGCPRPLVLKHVQRAVLDFCRRSQWFRATLDPITQVKNITDYELDDLPDEVRVNSILWIKRSGRLLRPTEYDITDDGRGFSLVSPPVETVRQALEVRAVLAPVRKFTTLEVRLFEEWAPVMAAGALQGLRRLPKKKWSDFRQAVLDAQTYENGILRAKNQAVRDRKNVSLHSTTKRFRV